MYVSFYMYSQGNGNITHLCSYIEHTLLQCITNLTTLAAARNNLINGTLERRTRQLLAENIAR